MNTELFKRYADIRSKISALEEEEALLKAGILSEMQKSQADNVTTDFGKFIIGVRKTYKYTDKVNKIAERLKLEQIKEQEKGLAQIKETTYLTYKGI